MMDKLFSSIDLRFALDDGKVGPGDNFSTG